MAERKTVDRIYLCGGDTRPGPRDECPNELHDWPLPSGYVDASEEAHRRMRKRWTQKRCPDCGIYGWPTPPSGYDAVRVPAPPTTDERPTDA